MLTNQEIVSTCVDKMVIQNKPAFEEDSCIYLTDTGLTCAVGCLINDQNLLEEMSAYNCDIAFYFEEPDSISAINKDKFPFKEESLDLLIALQKLHDKLEEEDTPHFGLVFSLEAKSLAKRFNLEVTW